MPTGRAGQASAIVEPESIEWTKRGDDGECDAVPRGALDGRDGGPDADGLAWNWQQRVAEPVRLRTWSAKRR
jgi:hypothetical protein